MQSAVLVSIPLTKEIDPDLDRGDAEVIHDAARGLIAAYGIPFAIVCSPYAATRQTALLLRHFAAELVEHSQSSTRAEDRWLNATIKARDAAQLLNSAIEGSRLDESIEERDFGDDIDDSFGDDDQEAEIDDENEEEDDVGPTRFNKGRHNSVNDLNDDDDDDDDENGSVYASKQKTGTRFSRPAAPVSFVSKRVDDVAPPRERPSNDRRGPANTPSRSLASGRNVTQVTKSKASSAGRVGGVRFEEKRANKAAKTDSSTLPTASSSGSHGGNIAIKIEPALGRLVVDEGSKRDVNESTRHHRIILGETSSAFSARVNDYMRPLITMTGVQIRKALKFSNAGSLSNRTCWFVTSTDVMRAVIGPNLIPASAVVQMTLKVLFAHPATRQFSWASIQQGPVVNPRGIPNAANVGVGPGPSRRIDPYEAARLEVTAGAKKAAAPYAFG